MSYAYLDQYGILHIVDNRETAEKYASGKIVETGIENGGGYPVADGKHVIVYTKKNEYKVNGAVYPLSSLESSYPAVAELVKKLV